MALDALVFEVNGVLFGIWSTEVVQVVRAVAIDPIPNSPPTVEGVINVRGQVVPVLDLRYLVQLPMKCLELTDHLIVMCLRRRDVAVRVDRAVDLVSLDETQLEGDSATALPFTRGIANTTYGFVHLVDLSKLLTPEDAATLETIPL